TVRGLAAAGCRVVVADLNDERGKAVAGAVGGEFARTDVCDEQSVRAAVDAAAGAGQPLRVAVSCAGIGWAARTVGRDGSPHDLAAYRKVIDVNLIGTFNLMRIAAAGMGATRAGRGGRRCMTGRAACVLPAIGVRVNTGSPATIARKIFGSGSAS